jgi:hypothetical protein
MRVEWGFIWRITILGALLGLLFCLVFLEGALDLAPYFVGICAAVSFLVAVLAEMWNMRNRREPE